MLEMNWVLIVVLACVTHLFVVAEPMILIKRKLGFKEEDIKGINKTKDFFVKMIYCNLCSGFWIGLLFTFNPLEAVIISVMAELIHKILR